MIENLFSRGWYNFALFFTALRAEGSTFFILDTKTLIKAPETVWPPSSRKFQCQLSPSLICIEVIEAKNALEILPFLKEKLLPHFWSDNRLVIIVRDFYFETRIPDEKPSVEYQVRLLFGVEVNIYRNVTINFSGPNCSGWFIRNVRNFGELEPTDNVKIPSSLFFSSRDPYETLFKDKVRESFFFESIFTGYHRYYILYRLGSLAYLPESYLTHEMVDIKAPEKTTLNSLDTDLLVYFNKNTDFLTEYLEFLNSLFCSPKLKSETVRKIAVSTMNRKNNEYFKLLRDEI